MLDEAALPKESTTFKLKVISTGGLGTGVTFTGISTPIFGVILAILPVLKP